MVVKEPKDYTVDEVCLFLVAIGLGKKQDAFRENSVDGSLLVELSDEDMKVDLGLSGLDTKRVKKGLDFAQSLAQGGGGGEDSEISERFKELEEENAQLKAEINKLKNPEPPKQEAPAPQAAPPPQPAPAPAQKQAPPPQHRNEHHVVKGAAGGAAKGAVVGAVAGAIAGDAGQGAKMGAAAGAAGGAMTGAGRRRQARRARRRGY